MYIFSWTRESKNIWISKSQVTYQHSICEETDVKVVSRSLENGSLVLTVINQEFLLAICTYSLRANNMCSLLYDYRILNVKCHIESRWYYRMAIL